MNRRRFSGSPLNRGEVTLDTEAEAQRVTEFVQQGNYHAAYNIALSGLNACRREHDQAGVDRFIAIIREIVDALDNEFGSKSK